MRTDHSQTRRGKFSSQPRGKGWFEKLGPKIATTLGLPNPHLYTSHFLRRSAATVAANAGADTVDLKRKFKWLSGDTAERCPNNSFL